MSRLKHQLICQYSGLQIGTLEYETVAGHMPYLTHWDGMCAIHPVFSLPKPKLLAFARNEWNRLAKAAENEETTEHESNCLRVCFLAVLHGLDSIKQEAAALPPLAIVQNNMNKLFTLSYWHYHLESKRFAFPEFKINKLNANGRFDNINHYLDACFSVKEEYESGVSDLVEQEKVNAAERALKALRNSWITPVGNKALWRWVRAHLPEKYSADAQGWMGTLFLGNEKTILDFDKDEIELMIEIITSECPAGTAILKPVRERLDKILQIHIDNKEAFTVDFAEYESFDTPEAALAAVMADEVVMIAPNPADFAKKVDYIRAHALFYLKQRAHAQQLQRVSKAGEL